MNAVWLDPRSRRIGRGDRPDPRIERPDEVLFRIAEVGVCGTDRKLARFEWGEPPSGDSVLIPGHEALGQVVETGPAVTHLKPGDWVVPTVRRPCVPACRCCARARRDLCLTGKYTERGIFRLHGYMTSFAVDAAGDLLPVPASLVDIAVLAEPLSVVEKAVEKAIRLHEDRIERALILGAGPIGFLTALALEARGITALIHSTESPAHARVRAITAAGFRYLEDLNPMEHAADFVVEATGSPAAAFTGLRCLRPCGVYAVLGAASGSGPVEFPELILNNHIVFGSVNSSPASTARAIQDLACFDRRTLKNFLRRAPLDAFADTVLNPPEDAFKLVHVITD